MDSMRVVIHFVIVQLARQVRGVPKNTRSKYSRRIVPMRRSTNGCETGADGTDLPSDPIPSLAHHGHATVLSIAFRSAVRLACLLPGNRFGGYRFNAFRRAAAYHSETGPSARNGLSLARNGFRFHGLHSEVNGPGLLLRSLAARFIRPFGFSAPPPEPVSPDSRRFPASSPLRTSRPTHPAALPISTPLREF